jgi:hypothetical protein
MTSDSQSESGGVVSSTALLDCEWKIEHRNDGISFMAFPYKVRGKTEYGWTIGPMDRHVAEWLFDAVKRKQSNGQAHPPPGQRGLSAKETHE